MGSMTDAGARVAWLEASARRLGAAADEVHAVDPARRWSDPVCHEVGVGIVEGDDDAVWMVGDWNTAVGERLAAACERLGIVTVWLDEYVQCSECWRLVWSRTYHGTCPLVWPEGADPVCTDCARRELAEDRDALLGWGMVNDAGQALPSQIDDDALTGAGFVKVPESFASGWYGREDSPAAVLSRILGASASGVEVVFRVDDAHAFETRYSAWAREPEGD